QGKRHLFVLLGGFALVYAIIWTLGVIQSRSLFQARLFLPGFVALAPLLAESVVQLSALDRPGFSISTFVRLSVAVVLALALVNQALYVLAFDPLGCLVGYQTRSEYLTRVLGDHYRAMEALEEIVPEDGQVLFLWEPRTYYSPRSAEPDAILDRWLHTIHLYGHDPAAIADAWRAEGVTHVLLYRSGLDHVLEKGLDPVASQDLETLNSLKADYLSLTRNVGSAYELYRLEETP
ncbi:MAG: hypothetical protein ACP5JJ_13730, partial [Anaerolineae bacterium]